MQCPACKGAEFRKTSVVEDAGTVEQTVCANKECAYILREEEIIEREGGEEMRRPRSVKPEAQPNGFAFGKDTEKPEDYIPTAADMLVAAIEMRENTIGEEARTLAKKIVESCAKVVLTGHLDYLIDETDMPTGEILSTAVKELKDRGYTVRKVAEPGAGTWVKVKWPTKKQKKRKTATKADNQATVTVVEKTPKKQRSRKEAMGANKEVQDKQRAASKRRKEILGSK